MDSESIEPNPLIQLAEKVGELAGTMKGMDTRLENVEGGVGEMKTALGEGGERFRAIEDEQKATNKTLEQMLTQQKIANGRTDKNEAEIKRAHGRIDLVMFLPRWFDKLAEHKVWGAVLIAAAGTTTGVLIQRFIF